LERVQEITWVDKELIRKAARMYAKTKPACIHWGVPTEQTNNCADCTRTMTGLMAVTGNLDAPGGNVLYVNPPTRTVAEFSRHRDLSKEARAIRLGGDRYKLGARVAFITPKVGLGGDSDRQTLSPKGRALVRHQPGGCPAPMPKRPMRPLKNWISWL
jgi:anaerobic selenocysteine-containing dehydrogenase